MKASEEERKLISIQVGTPRQSNVFTAMMEIYPEMRKAAIASLSNMDAAMEENIKVTNTAHAAVGRLKSSWDRLVNSPTADQFTGGLLDIGSGLIQAANNTIGNTSASKRPTYSNPSGANISGVAQSNMLTFTKPAEWVAGMLGNKNQEKFWQDINDGIMENLGISHKAVLPGDVFQSEAEGIHAHTGTPKT